MLFKDAARLKTCLVALLIVTPLTYKDKDRSERELLSVQYSTSRVVKMLKKYLAVFAFLNVVCLVLLLSYRKDSTMTFFLTKPYHVGKNKFSWWIKEHVQLGTEAPKNNQEETQVPTTTSKTLERCPDTPPNLLGPIHVEFDSNRTLDEVRKEVGPLLQDGGQYKPLDCIAQQKVAIIIPFRNRHEHLIHWLHYLHPILIRQQLDYRVFVINQDGEGVWNKGILMNAGYVEALKKYDYECFVFADVDLVPMDDRNLYRCFDNPRHLAVAMDKFNFHLPYYGYFGGVTAFSKSQFLMINGFPNTYWGWGGEDDDIYRRIIHRGMSISRPDMVTGKYRMFKHERDLHNDPNPKRFTKLSETDWAMEKDGINSLKYTVKEVVKDRLYTYINVDNEASPS